MRALLVGVCLALAACGQNAAAPAEDARTQAAPATSLFTYGGGFAPVLTGGVMTGEHTPPPTWFICDSIDGDDVFVASPPDEGGAFLFAHYNRETKHAQRMNVRLSGELFAAPNGPAQAFVDEADTQGVIYTIDPARMSGADAATTAPVIGLDFASEEFHCRWFEHMLFLGFTGSQSVVVRRAGENIELMIFNAGSEGALMVEMQHGEQSTITDVSAENGREGGGRDRDDVLQFVFDSASDGASYTVWTAEGEPAVLQPSRDGEVTQTDEFQAYALAR